MNDWNTWNVLYNPSFSSTNGAINGNEFTLTSSPLSGAYYSTPDQEDWSDFKFNMTNKYQSGDLNNTGDYASFYSQSFFKKHLRWNEDFSVFDETYMYNRSYPDYYNNIMEFEPTNLHMKNNYPIYEDYTNSWDTWNWNSGVTDTFSNYNTGNFTSYLKNDISYYSPSSFGDFSTTSGSENTFGDLSASNSSSAIFESTHLNYAAFQKWNEDFSSYNPGYMTHYSSPVTYGGSGNSYLFQSNMLEMQNNFPIVDYNNDWNAWNYNVDHSGLTWDPLTQVISASLEQESDVEKYPQNFDDFTTTAGYEKGFDNPDALKDSGNGMVTFNTTHLNEQDVMLWNEPFNSFNETYMSQNFSPTDYNNTQVFNGDNVTIQNIQPSDSYNANFPDGWTQPQYDSQLAAYSLTSGELTASVLQKNVASVTKTGVSSSDALSDLTDDDGSNIWEASRHIGNSNDNEVQEDGASFSTTSGVSTTDNSLYDELVVGHPPYVTTYYLFSQYDDNYMRDFTFQRTVSGFDPITIWGADQYDFYPSVSESSREVTQYKISLKTLFDFLIGSSCHFKIYIKHDDGSWDSIYTHSGEEGWASHTLTLNAGNQYIRSNGRVSIMLEFTCTSTSTDLFYQTAKGRLACDVAKLTVTHKAKTSTVKFNFDSGVLDGAKDYYIFAGGRSTTSGEKAVLKANGNSICNFNYGTSSTWFTCSCTVPNVNEILIDLGDVDGEYETQGIQIDYLYIFATEEWNNVLITKNFNVNNFLNFNEDSNYLEKFDVSLSFEYIYTRNDPALSNYTKISVYNAINAPNDKSLHTGTHSFSANFEFNSTSLDSFQVEFDISNAHLQISQFHIEAEFQCLDNSQNYKLEQEFRVSLPPYLHRTGNQAFNGDFKVETEGVFDKNGGVGSMEIFVEIYEDSTLLGTSLVEFINETRSYSFNFTLRDYVPIGVPITHFEIVYVLSGDLAETTISNISYWDRKDTVNIPTLTTYISLDLENPADYEINSAGLYYKYESQIVPAEFLFEIKNPEGDWEPISYESTISPDPIQLSIFSASEDYLDENNNYNVQLRFNMTGARFYQENEFQFFLSELKIVYNRVRIGDDEAISGEVYNTIEHEFLNYYDGYQDWAKLYDINIHFSFYWNPFKCLDGDSQVYNEQNFTIEFDTTFDVNEQEFGNWNVTTSFNLIALAGEYLQIYIDVKTTANPNWETKYSSIYTSGASPSFDIRSAIGEGTYLTNIRIQYILKGHSPNLDIDVLRLMDNRSNGERPVLETEFYMNLEDVSLYTIESLNIEFSHKLLEPINTFEFLVKDKDGVWQECDNSYIIDSLYENSIDLPVTSYIDNNNEVYFKFHIEGIEHYDDHAFIFELNKFKLTYRWTRTGGDNNAEMSYSNFDLDGFLNRYDDFEGDNTYLMKYEVELTFQHQYKQKDIRYTPIANFHINGDVEGISATNNIFTNGTLNKIFNFTSAGTSEGFDMEFEVSNGELIITNFAVNARFLCLNISGKEYLEQNFIVNTTDDGIGLSNGEKEQGVFVVNTTYLFNAGDNGRFMYYVDIKTDNDPEWKRVDVENLNPVAQYTEYSFNITDYMHHNDMYVFDDFRVTYNISGNNAELWVDDLSLYYSEAPQFRMFMYVDLMNMSIYDRPRDVILNYRYCSNVTIDDFTLSIWDAQTMSWDTIDNETLTTSWREGTFLINNQTYATEDLNYTFKIEAFLPLYPNFDGSDRAFELMIDTFRVDYEWVRKGGEIEASVTKQIDSSFLDRFDNSTFDNYKDQITVDLSFDYTFTKYNSDDSYAIVEFNDTVIRQTLDGTLFEYKFNYDSILDNDGFMVNFTIVNGSLHIWNFNIDFEYECIEKLTNYHELTQTFIWDYPKEWNFTDYSLLFLNTTYDFNMDESDLLTYTESNKLEISIDLLIPSYGWVTTESNFINQDSIGTISFDVREFHNAHPEFQPSEDIRIKFIVTGNNSELIVSNIQFYERVLSSAQVKCEITTPIEFLSPANSIEYSLIFKTNITDNTYSNINISLWDEEYQKWESVNYNFSQTEQNQLYILNVVSTQNWLNLSIFAYNPLEEFELEIVEIQTSVINYFNTSRLFSDSVQNVAFAGWINAHELNGNSSLYGEYNDNGDIRNYLYIDSQGSICFDHNRMSGDPAKSAPGLIQVDEWIYFAMVKTFDQITFYKNGRQFGDSVNYNDVYSGFPPQESGVGARYYQGSWNHDLLNGALDDFRVFNNQITPLEVDYLYNWGVGRNITLYEKSERSYEFIPQEYYRINNLDTGETGQWVEFYSNSVNILADIGELPSNFSIDYKVIDTAGNENITTYYNKEFEQMLLSKETNITFANNLLNLNQIGKERIISILNEGQFGNINNLKVLINGFNFGEAILNGDNYEISFGAQNNVSNLIGYSDPILSDKIYSNINPYNDYCWEVRKDNFYGVIKDVLIEEGISIINPLIYNFSRALDLNHLYNRGFVLKNFQSIKSVYYYNTTDNQKYTLDYYYDYLIDEQGTVYFLDESAIHSLNYSEVKDKKVYFDYIASEFTDQLNLINADGFFVNFTMPASYFNHTTIDKLTIRFNDLRDQSYAKVFYDLNLRKYLIDKAKYQIDSVSMGDIVKIPLYISIDDLSMSNTNQPFDLRMLRSIEFDIEDSDRWPGSFEKAFNNYTALDLPYQRVGISDLKLYNLIADSEQTDKDGYVNSTMEVIAEDYYGYHAENRFKIRRLDLNLTNLYLYYNQSRLSGITNTQYSDFIELNYRFNETLTEFPMAQFVKIPISLLNNSNNQGFSLSGIYWIESNINSLSPLFAKYYYSKLEVPKILGLHDLKLSSIGSPIHNILIDKKISLNVTQEQLDPINPIYLEQDYYEVNYEDSIVLSGCILEDDIYIIEDEIHEYSYQEAIDPKGSIGETSYILKKKAPIGDSNYILNDQLSIYYLNEKLEKIPLYSNFTSVYKNNSILASKDPEISYIDNEFYVTIYWNSQSDHLITFDTELLISYKTHGKPASPGSVSRLDEYGHTINDNLIEIPFAKYDPINDGWITESNFTERFSIQKKLLLKEVTTSSITLEGEYYNLKSQLVKLGIIELDNVYLNNSGVIEGINESDYTYSINSEGDLFIQYYDFEVGDRWTVSYYVPYPVVFDHPISEIYSFRVISSINNSLYIDLDESEYELRDYEMFFTDLYTDVFSQEFFDIYDLFEITYRAPYAKRMDLSSNLLLLQQNKNGDLVPVDNIEIDSMGFFEYQNVFSIEGLSLPMGGKQMVNMRLEYLPLEVFNASSQTYKPISYTVDGNFIYYHKQSDQWFKNFRIITKPQPTTLKMVDYETNNNMVVFQKHYDNRYYQYTQNPMDALEKGEEYTSVQIDTLYSKEYQFTFKLTDEIYGAGIPNKAVWLQIGFVPKSETEFMNPSLKLEDGTNPYYESLGTDPLNWKGPGIAPNKMFNRPVLYNLAQQDGDTMFYGPYIWKYAITDNFGKATFDVTFDENYLEHYLKIFGNSAKDIEDISLYIRAFSSKFDWEEFSLNQLNYTLCSEEGNIFTGENIVENYDFEDQMKYDSTYLSGIIRLHKCDTALGLHDYLKYELPSFNFSVNSSSQFSPLKMKVKLAEANQIPSEDNSLDNLIRLHAANELEATSVSILSEENPTYALLEFINGSSGQTIHSLYREINASDQLGEISIDNATMAVILSKLGSGMHSIKVQTLESKYYKQPPSVIVPFEVIPPNNMKFGEKITNLDLIEPLVSTWGTAYDGDKEAPFESNYPAILGTVWIDPDFYGIGEEREEKERSINDYIETTIYCTLHNENGSVTTFELSGVELRPGNRDGIYSFVHYFGPEGEYLMGLDFALNVTFNINNCKDSVFEDHRNVNIKLLDLRIEENPSSSSPKTLWSIAQDQFDSSLQGLTVLTSDNMVSNSENVVLGGIQNEELYGVEVQYYYNNETSEYSLSEDHPYLDLNYLSDITPKALIGELNYEEHEFVLGSDWEIPYQDPDIYSFANLSMINFTETGNKPDNLEEFTVIYKFTFDAPYYAVSQLGYQNNMNYSWVWINFSNGIIKGSEDSYSPMFIKYCDKIEGNGVINSFTLNYSIQGISSFNEN
ncbi:MAG: hypothetical protein P8Y97_02145, partial [Candidatus Lokiarchaeota archaeon]